MSDIDAKPVEAVDTNPVEVADTSAEPATDTANGDATVDSKPVEVTGTPAVASADKPADSEVETKTAKTGDTAADEPTPDPETRTVDPKFIPPVGMLRITQKSLAVKSDPNTLPETDDPREIRKQVEFYFSDTNLPTDKFLLGQVGAEENKPVPIKLVASFGRMRRFKPYAAVVKALQDSHTLVVEGADGEETVKRKEAIDLKNLVEKDECGSYVKGFGDETDNTQYDIEKWVGELGKYKAVRLRRGDEKGFKGAINIIWADKETAEKFHALDPKPKWRGYPLFILTKSEYNEMKAQDIRDGKIQPKETRPPGRGRGRGRGRGQYRGNDRRGANDDWNKRRDRDQQNGFRGGRGNFNGRGRGRGDGRGRGRGRGDFRGRPNREQEVQAPVNDGRPKINISKTQSAETNGKRGRDDETSAKEPPSKKVDTKE
ncbi:hypothetical protein F5Y18DRAFT_380639 [Xylariaceae sp. FL1019]|nr:hypothetical protein F5Y18DRAFT_380639 [Xylariaceae sp. FL1019]